MSAPSFGIRRGFTNSVVSPSTKRSSVVRLGARCRELADQDLMLEQQRFRGDGADATGAQEFCEGDEQVNREEEHFAHGWNAITPAMLRKSAQKRGLALRVK